MIVVSATVWPEGKQALAYEILNATINNTASPTDKVQSYMAHVLARPKEEFGIIGYEADVEVQGHAYNGGFVPLLMSVLAGASVEDGSWDEAGKLVLPPSRSLARIVLRQMHEFEARLRART